MEEKGPVALRPHYDVEGWLRDIRSLMTASQRVRGPRFCPNCGSPVEPGDRFCGNCGYRLF